MKILLIAGGWSSERQISLNGAENVKQALFELGHEVTLLDLQKDFGALLTTAARHDFAFINLHGAPGEDGLIQAMLDTISCPYQGSGPAGSFLALHKAAAKQIFRKAGIPTADWEFLPERPDAGWKTSLTFPVFAKSNTGGSSLHLARAENMPALGTALQEIFIHGEAALLEPELKGQEVTCAILGSRALPPVLIVPKEGSFFDFTNKYAKDGASEICPAPIDADQTRRVQELAMAAHTALGLSGYSRSDFILDKNGNFTILETNTLPGMTSASLVPKEAKAAGINFNDLVRELIELGLAERGVK